jgi:tRNA modification GTPase
VNDTIFAVATGAGKAAVAIVRVSGPSCSLILRTTCPGVYFFGRRATITRIVGHTGELIDNGIVLYFPAPRSFTGQDVIEFQVAGSPAILAQLLRTLSNFPATRPAEAGEFTRRSFANGKRDLAEVEGLAAIIDAETGAQLKRAQSSAFGLLSRECEGIGAEILNSMVAIETALDFSDTDGFDAASTERVFDAIDDTRTRIRSLLNCSEGPERLQDGLVVVIAGPPNVGKSSLINYLSRREASIVSSFPGTTRDLIEVPMDIDGFPVIFVDTAGIRDPKDPIEAEGIARALKKSESADLTLWLSCCLEEDANTPTKLGEVIRVRTKCDLAHSDFVGGEALNISVKTGAGLDALLARIAEFTRAQLGGIASSLLTTQRQRAAVLDADLALGRLLKHRDAPTELLAEELRLAARCMSRVVGRIDVEDVLVGIFSRLCVGK